MNITELNRRTGLPTRMACDRPRLETTGKGRLEIFVGENDREGKLILIETTVNELLELALLALPAGGPPISAGTNRDKVADRLAILDNALREWICLSETA